MSNPRKNHAYGINLAVAQELTAARLEAGYTNEALAAELPSLSLSSVQRYLSGRAAIDVETLSMICRVIEVPEVDIIRSAQERLGKPEQTADEIRSLDLPEATKERMIRSLDQGHEARRRA